MSFLDWVLLAGGGLIVAALLVLAGTVAWSLLK